MPEHEPWLTALFNDHLAGVANSVLSMLGLKTFERPWSTPMCMEILVAVIIVILFAILKSKLSMDRPGTLQHSLEVIYDFLHKSPKTMSAMTGRSISRYSGRSSSLSCFRT